MSENEICDNPVYNYYLVCPKCKQDLTFKNLGAMGIEACCINHKCNSSVEGHGTTESLALIDFLWNYLNIFIKRGF